MSNVTNDEFRKSRTAAAIGRTRRLASGFGLFFFLGGMLSALVSVSDGRDWPMLLIALATIAIGTLMLRSAWRNRNVLQSPLLTMVREHPEQIVWIYMETAKKYGESNKTVSIRCFPLAVFTLQAIDAEAVLAELASWCPRASVGFSAEKLKMFETQPHVLLAGH